MTSDDNQNNASGKGVDDSVKSGQSQQNTISILKPGSNNDLIDQLRVGLWTKHPLTMNTTHRILLKLPNVLL